MKVDRDYLKDRYHGKTTEELLGIHAGGELTDLAYDVLEAELESRAVPVPQRREAETSTTSSGGLGTFLKEHWQGKRRLASAYWIVGGVGTAVVLAMALTVGMILPDYLPVSKETGFSIFVGIVGVLTVPYMIFAWVSIWRCAWNTDWKGWGIIARIVVVLSIARLVTLLLGGRYV